MGCELEAEYSFGGIQTALAYSRNGYIKGGYGVKRTKNDSARMREMSATNYMD